MLRTKQLHLSGFGKTLAIVLAFFGFAISSQAAGLSGSYTIDKSKAASSSNYISFNDADSDLTFGVRSSGGTANGPGVSAAVTFSVADGIYLEQVTVPKIKGASKINSITFNSSSKDSAKV